MKELPGDWKNLFLHVSLTIGSSSQIWIVALIPTDLLTPRRQVSLKRDTEVWHNVMLFGAISLSMQAAQWLEGNQSLEHIERAHHGDEYACINVGTATYYKILCNLTGSRGATMVH